MILVALSPTALEEYRGLLGEINTLAQEDLVALWRSMEHLDRDQLWAALRAGVPEIVELYRATAADTAMLFYSETQGVSFSSTEGLAASAVNREQVESSLRWALFSPQNAEPLALISGLVQRHVVNGARQYGLSGFANAGSGWYRAARPGACEFCRMLATRAATEWGPYSSAEAAVTVGAGTTKRRKGGAQPSGDTFHDNCMCIPVKSSEYQVPDHVEAWAAEYNAATKRVGNAFDYKSILAEMRKVG